MGKGLCGVGEGGDGYVRGAVESGSAQSCRASSVIANCKRLVAPSCMAMAWSAIPSYGMGAAEQAIESAPSEMISF